MSGRIGNGETNSRLNRFLENAEKKAQDSLEKLSSGQIFSSQDPRPAERSLSDSLEFKLRDLSSAKRTINEGVSLLQVADGGMNEIGNILVRMKELNIQAASSTVDDRARRFLMVEYQALFNEINRIANTTEYNGMNLLQGDTGSNNRPENLMLRIGTPQFDPDTGEDANLISLDQLQEIAVTTKALGLKSAQDILEDSDLIEGITLTDVEDLLMPDESEFATSFDQAQNSLSMQRSIFGAMQSRLQRGQDFVNVYEENLAAAKSRISDVDYASELAKLTQANVLFKATTSLLAHSNLNTQMTLSLLQSLT